MAQINVKFMCRTCLNNPDDFCSVFDIRLVNDEQLLISEMILDCTNVEIKDTDTITRYICNECVGQLVQCYSFRKKCQESNVYLQIKEEELEIVEAGYSKDDYDEIRPDFSHPEDDIIYEEEDDHEDMDDDEDPIQDEVPLPIDEKPKVRKKKRRKSNLTCEICNLKFENTDKLRYHIAKHNETYDFLCNICGEKFKIKRAYSDHMKRHDSNFKCDICEKSFPSNFQLKLHLRTHTGEKPHVCEVCGMAYKQNSDLKIHMRRHTGEKPVKCRICDKTFISASYRAKHEVYHQDPSIRPFKCNICYKDFRLKKYYRQHLKTHNKNEK